MYYLLIKKKAFINYIISILNINVSTVIKCLHIRNSRRNILSGRKINPSINSFFGLFNLQTYTYQNGFKNPYNNHTMSAPARYKWNTTSRLHTFLIHSIVFVPPGQIFQFQIQYSISGERSRHFLNTSAASIYLIVMSQTALWTWNCSLGEFRDEVRILSVLKKHRSEVVYTC